MTFLHPLKFMQDNISITKNDKLKVLDHMKCVILCHYHFYKKLPTKLVQRKV